MFFSVTCFFWAPSDGFPCCVQLSQTNIIKWTQSELFTVMLASFTSQSELWQHHSHPSPHNMLSDLPLSFLGERRWLGKLTPDTELVRSKCLCKGEEKHTFCCYSQHFCVAAARMVTFLFIHSFIVLLCETDTRPMFSPGLASMAKQNRNTNQQITHSRSHQDCCHSCQRICWKGTNKKC